MGLFGGFGQQELQSVLLIWNHTVQHDCYDLTLCKCNSINLALLFLKGVSVSYRLFFGSSSHLEYDQFSDLELRPSDFIILRD